MNSPMFHLIFDGMEFLVKRNSDGSFYPLSVWIKTQMLQMHIDSASNLQNVLATLFNILVNKCSNKNIPAGKLTCDVVG